MFEKKARFVGCSDDEKNADIIVAGIPYDMTSTYRKGSDLGPGALREMSESIESFSPRQFSDITDFNICDIGDLEIQGIEPEKAVKEIENAAQYIIESGKKGVFIGGEHLVSYPIVKKYAEKYPDLKVLYFDAHADMRDDYDGCRLSHAAAARRIFESAGEKALYMFGIRSFEKNEMMFIRDNMIPCDTELVEIDSAVQAVKNSPVYISIDMDVFDPSEVPGVGNPEAGGITYRGFMKVISELENIKNIVGFDIVELSPKYDPSGASSAFAAKIMREMLLMLADGEDLEL
ncbi:MAG: agmatinase [Candidatus Goldiibacteriota bacterium]